VPEPYSVKAREKEDSAVLSISKAAVTEVMLSFPEQNDIIMTNLLCQYGLTRDGEDTAGGGGGQDDEAHAQMREDIRVLFCQLQYYVTLSLHCTLHPDQVGASLR
jgi:hypothetical protein